MITNEIHHIIAAALAEDIGSGDITSQLLISETAQAEMQFVARDNMVACGMFIPAAVYAQIIPPPVGGRLGGEHDMEKPEQVSPHPNPPPEGEGIVTVKICVSEGEHVKAGTILAKANGSARALLAGERVALNFMQRMCGVATLTAQYVGAVRGTKAIILDTRKTMPGLRALDKYAVKTGGGRNHRMGLYDMVLVKDNHVALSESIGEAVKKVREGTSLLVEVECDTLSQVEDALKAKPDRILLDNMDIATLRKAVMMAGGKIPLEASGGVSLNMVRAIAETGVDYISVGKLTHSALAADIGADITIQSKP